VPSQSNKTAAGELENKMSNGTMETLLVNKMISLRKSEAMFARSLQLVQNGILNIDLHAAHRKLEAEVSEVEQLLSRVGEPGSAHVSTLLASEAPQQLTSSVWM
jgi:hypothetical protein